MYLDLAQKASFCAKGGETVKRSVSAFVAEYWISGLHWSKSFHAKSFSWKRRETVARSVGAFLSEAAAYPNGFRAKTVKWKRLNTFRSRHFIIWFVHENLAQNPRFCSLNCLNSENLYFLQRFVRNNYMFGQTGDQLYRWFLCSLKTTWIPREDVIKMATYLLPDVLDTTIICWVRETWEQSCASSRAVFWSFRSSAGRIV